ncbi:hypothetical protein E2P81_ATG06325 [Venturia nashicola]|nr:hypothetical protein E2P81_ATG06325 [Venturia nashicola]
MAGYLLRSGVPGCLVLSSQDLDHLFLSGAPGISGLPGFLFCGIGTAALAPQHSTRLTNSSDQFFKTNSSRPTLQDQLFRPRLQDQLFRPRLQDQLFKINMKLLLVPIALGLFTSLASACQCLTNGTPSFLTTQQACANCKGGSFSDVTGQCSIPSNHACFANLCNEYGNGRNLDDLEVGRSGLEATGESVAGPCRNGHRDRQDIGVIDDDNVSYRWINDCCEEGNDVRELNLSFGIVVRTTTFFSFSSVSVFLDHSSTIVVLITTAVIRWHRLPFMNVALRGEIPPSVEISQQPLAGKNLVYAIFSQAWHAQIARINCMAVHPRVLFGFTVEAQRS